MGRAPTVSPVERSPYIRMTVPAYGAPGGAGETAPPSAAAGAGGVARARRGPRPGASRIRLHRPRRPRRSALHIPPAALRGERAAGRRRSPGARWLTPRQPKSTSSERSRCLTATPYRNSHFRATGPTLRLIRTGLGGNARTQFERGPGSSALQCDTSVRPRHQRDTAVPLDSGRHFWEHGQQRPRAQRAGGSSSHGGGGRAAVVCAVAPPPGTAGGQPAVTPGVTTGTPRACRWCEGRWRRGLRPGQRTV